MADQQPIALAVIAGLDKYHALTFTRMFNVEIPKGEYAQGFHPMPAEARVVFVWDEDFAKAQAIAEQYNVPHPCRTLDEALDKADAVIIADDVVMTHQRWAPAVMERGLPYFHDKPFATSYAEAERLIEQARRHDAVMFSSSALAFTQELETLGPQLESEGGVQLGVAYGPNGRFLYYGIHPLTALYSAMGPGLASVQNTGRSGRHMVRLEWRDGRSGMVVCDERVKGFGLTLYTPKAVHTTSANDARHFYYNTMRAFIEMVLTREIPVPWEQTLEIMRVLDTVEAAARRGDTSVISL